MKTKITKLLALLMALCLMLGALLSCSGGKNGKITLVLAGEETVEYSIKIDDLDTSKGLAAALEYLKENEGVDYEIKGTYLEYVGDVKNDYDKGIYVYLYTSVVSDIDVSMYATTVEYNGATLTNAGVGVYEMTLEDGAIIYIGTIQW